MTIRMKQSSYWELIEYLAALATPEQILAFQLSPERQDYLQDLMERNNEGELSSQELLELEDFVEFNQQVMILKARAAAALNPVS